MRGAVPGENRCSHGDVEDRLFLRGTALLPGDGVSVEILPPFSKGGPALGMRAGSRHAGRFSACVPAPNTRAGAQHTGQRPTHGPALGTRTGPSTLRLFLGTDTAISCPRRLTATVVRAFGRVDERGPDGSSGSTNRGSRRFPRLVRIEGEGGHHAANEPPGDRRNEPPGG